MQFLFFFSFIIFAQEGACRGGGPLRLRPEEESTLGFEQIDQRPGWPGMEKRTTDGDRRIQETNGPDWHIYLERLRTITQLRPSIYGTMKGITSRKSWARAPWCSCGRECKTCFTFWLSSGVLQCWAKHIWELCKPYFKIRCTWTTRPKTPGHRSLIIVKRIFDNVSISSSSGVLFSSSFFRSRLLRFAICVCFVEW